MVFLILHLIICRIRVIVLTARDSYTKTIDSIIAKKLALSKVYILMHIMYGNTISVETFNRVSTVINLLSIDFIQLNLALRDGTDIITT